MHLTIGIQTYTWVDILHEAGVSNDRSRASLPYSNGNGGPSAAFLKGFSDIMPALADRNAIDNALARLRRQRLGQLFPGAGDHLNQINSLGDIAVDTTVVKRHGALCELVTDGDPLQLHFPGNTLEVPRYLEAPLRFIVDAPGSFPVKTIIGLPNDNQKLIVARHLVGHGFLRVTDSRACTSRSEHGKKRRR
jgi:hypothetical protein